MSGPAANTNAENPENPDVTKVDTDGPPSPLEGITLPEEGLGFGAGTLDYNPDPNVGGRGAIGTNIPNNGDYNPEVKALQTYIAQQLDGEEWDGNEYGNTTALSQFGIDGVWRCETQRAFNSLLENKGIEGNLGSEKTQADAGKAGCPPAYVLDKETQKALNDSDKKKKEASAEDLAEQPVAFSDQCLLVDNLPTIFAESKPPNPKPEFYDKTHSFSRRDIKYKNIHKIDTKDPATIMNRLKITKGSGQFLNIRHYQLSQLTPTIRLYKQYYESPDAAPKEVEFKFPSFVDPTDDLQSMLNSELQRGVGMGIESFNFNFIGVQPATVKKDIEANLTIFAQNFNELFKFRNGEDQNGKPLSYRIIDLVLLEPKYRFITKEGDSQKTRVFNPNFYEIKVKAGWASTGGGGLLSDDLAAAIKDNQVEMFLVLVEHRFDFQDDGSVRLNLKFRARLESVFLDKRSDVLFEPDVIRLRENRQKKLEEIVTAKVKLDEEQKSVCKDIEGDIVKLRKSYELTIEREREQAYLSLLRGLLTSGCVYTAVVTENPEFPGYELKVENYTCESGDFLSKSLIMEPGVRRVNYFYLGDLIALAVNNVLVNMEEQSRIQKKLNYGNVKFALGPAPLDHLRATPGPQGLKEGDIPSKEFMDAFNDENLDMGRLGLNIADIPISVELYSDFMREKVIKGRKNTYPLLVFIRDVIKDLVFEALGPQCGSGDRQINLRLATAQISADSGPGNSDQMGEKIGNKSALPLDEYAKNLTVPLDSESGGLFGRKNKNKNAKTKFVFDSFNRKPLEQSFEYFLIYPYSYEPKGLAFEKQKGGPANRYERDLSNGIFHVSTGLDRGLTKTMNFEKTDQPFLREARYEQSDFKPELQLSNVYNTRITMYGNNLLFPGCQVYVNPRGLGSEELGDPGITNSHANIMGLGGYHLVKQVRHNIDASGYTTTVDAMFTTSGDGKGSVMDNQTRIGDTVVIECADLTEEIKNLQNDISAGDQ